MPIPASVIDNVKEHILTGVEEQISDLQPVLGRQVEVATVLAEIKQLHQLLTGFPPEPTIVDALTNKIIPVLTDIQSAKLPRSDLGKVLADIYLLKQALQQRFQGWLDNHQTTVAETEKLESILNSIISQTQKLLASRPDVAAIMDDLAAIKNLRGGPADAVSFHDFHVLQVAFKHVWLHAFDSHLKDAVEQLYQEIVLAPLEAGTSLPAPDALDDVIQLQEFLLSVRNSAGKVSYDGIPQEVVKVFHPTPFEWAGLGTKEQSNVNVIADEILSGNLSKDDIESRKKIVADLFKKAPSPVGRIFKLIMEIDRALKEPYAFDVFAPGSYNYGLMLTYRQKWEPGEYQAGELVATIPLAPSETRKFVKKRVVKKSRAVKETEKSMSSRSMQTSETSRAESEIMQKAVTATNFKMTSHGAFNVGIGSIDTTTEFGGNQEQHSILNKKEFHEATIKAAEEYRLERSMEIDTSLSEEMEETFSGEISNPNNEITVTYLFYELQRRYKIREFIHRVRPIILVAQDVPEPHEIDEAWLIQYQWIIARVLLDDSFRAALDYLTSGFAGDEVSIEIAKARWEDQREQAKSLEATVNAQLVSREALRQTLVDTAMQKKMAEAAEMSTGMKVWTLDLMPDPAKTAANILEAQRAAAETRLSYMEQALADAQEKLRQASNAFAQATKEYAAAMQNQFTRHTAIDQLRIHIKQNILYYMQAIWDHEPPDQRFFRLYKQTVICPQPQLECATKANGVRGPLGFEMQFINICTPVFSGVGGVEHELAEVADLDNPLGYKGNYILFPLKDECYLTTYMLTDFADNYLGLIDPDGSDSFDAENFERRWQEAEGDSNKRASLRDELIKFLSVVRRSTDEIIIPTGQLFIEALPGSHPLLEDFKLLHRFEDIRKVKAEVRHTELENLRLASRLAEGQDETALLEDPDIEKKIVVTGNSAIVIDPNA